MKQPVYQLIKLLIIAINTTYLFLSNPAYNIDNTPIVNYFFISFFTFDTILKMIPYGLITHENSYFKNFRNIFDFIVISIAYIEQILGKYYNI